MTNYEKIKSMSIDDLEQLLEAFVTFECPVPIEKDIECADCVLCRFCYIKSGDARNWLNSEVKE